MLSDVVMNKDTTPHNIAVAWVRTYRAVREVGDWRRLMLTYRELMHRIRDAERVASWKETP